MKLIMGSLERSVIYVSKSHVAAGFEHAIKIKINVQRN